jgi:hypothetical protein
VIGDLPLFATLETRPSDPTEAARNAVWDELSKIDPDALAPREAATLLYRLAALRDRRDDGFDDTVDSSR